MEVPSLRRDSTQGRRPMLQSSSWSQSISAEVRQVPRATVLRRGGMVGSAVKIVKEKYHQNGGLCEGANGDRDGFGYGHIVVGG